MSETAFSLLDEQVRLTLLAAAEALATAPGQLYPLVYVGPLARADALEAAVSEAASLFGIRCASWPDPPGSGPVLVLCRADELTAALDRLPERAQLIAWGSVAAADLPEAARSAVLAPGNLVVDLEVVPAARPWTDSLARSLAGVGRPGAGPVVVVAPAESLRLHADHALLLLEAAGIAASAVTLPAIPDETRVAVAVWTVDAVPPTGDAARIAADLRASAGALVLVTDAASWEWLGTQPGWSDGGLGCAVLMVGPPASEAALSALPWPEARAMWVGAPRAADADAVLFPAGTTLLEALGYLDVSGRAGRLVAWQGDAVAAAEVAGRPSGAVVVSVELSGEGLLVERERVLHALDSIRRWPALRLAVVWRGPGARESGADEPVQRIGFHFSRLDDERSGDKALCGPRRSVAVRDVAEALVGYGLGDAALAVLREAERASRWGVEEEMLLGFLVAAADPQEAITRLRHAAVRLASTPADESAWTRQTDATLNALLLMVRTRQVSARDAWGTVASWMAKAGRVWVVTGRHAAVLFELAARAGRVNDAREFAAMFREMTSAEDPLSRSLAPVLQAVVGIGA